MEVGRERVYSFGMKYVLAALLVAIGGYLIYLGNRRADSVAGIAEKAGKDIANAFDGKSRQGEHVYYYVGGGAMIVAGVFTALRKKPLFE